MSTVKTAIDKARSETKALQKKIEANTAKRHAELRAEVADAATDAKRLATSIKTLAAGQRADAKQHLQDAASRLEEAATHAKSVADASEAQLRLTNRAMFDRTQLALQNVSHAIALTRSSASKN